MSRGLLNIRLALKIILKNVVKIIQFLSMARQGIVGRLTLTLTHFSRKMRFKTYFQKDFPCLNAPEQIMYSPK